MCSKSEVIITKEGPCNNSHTMFAVQIVDVLLEYRTICTAKFVLHAFVFYYTALQNVWSGSKSAFTFGLIKILTHPWIFTCFHGKKTKIFFFFEKKIQISRLKKSIFCLFLSFCWTASNMYRLSYINALPINQFY